MDAHCMFEGRYEVGSKQRTMNFNWANELAKNALKTAQKRIDSVLDIAPEDEEVISFSCSCSYSYSLSKRFVQQP